MEYGTLDAHGSTFDEYGEPIKELSIYDIEEKITGTWDIIDHLDMIIEVVHSMGLDPRDETKMLSLLNGAKDLHDLRCQRLFDTYEKYLQQEFKKKQTITKTKSERYYRATYYDNNTL